MISGRARVGRSIVLLGLALTALAFLAYLSVPTALGVVLDARKAGGILAAFGFAVELLALVGWPENRKSGRWRVVVLSTAILSLLVVGLFVKLLFLTIDEQEVRFGHDGVDLSGTLHLPRTAAPVPAVVIVHGAGSGLRKEPAFYARLFARQGIAGLAYDKRGTGGSTGKRWEAGYEDLAQDALAGLRFLQGRKEVDQARVGILGFSEGEWVGTLAAAASGDAAFLVVVSPSGRSPADQVLYEVETVLRLRGYGEDVIGRAVSLNERLFEFVRSGAHREALEAALQEVRKEPWFGAAKLPDELGASEDWAWWRSVMDFDPAPVWSRLRCPVLLVSGGRDPKSPVTDSQARIQRALSAGGNRDVTGRIFPRAEHGLVEWWLPGRLPPPRFPRGYLDLLVNWVASKTQTVGSAS